MKGAELISVVVPIYNVEKYLEKCVTSILEQTYSNLEVILVDDGSPDKCGDMCEKFKNKDARIKVIHKTNGGLSDARNVGIINSTGKYITFVDSDDYIDNNYVELLYNTLISNNADISIVSHRVVYNGKCIDRLANEEFCGNSKLILEKVLYNNGADISAWGKLYKTELFNQIKFPKGKIYEDIATTYKLIDLSNKIAVCPKALYNYVYREEAITKNEFSEKDLDIITSTKEMTDYIKNKYPDLEDACNQRMMLSYLHILKKLAKSKKRYKETEKQVLTYIRNNKKPVLRDSKTLMKYKIGIYSSLPGLGFYKFMIKGFEKLRNYEI